MAQWCVNPSTAAAQVILDELVRSGVNDVVLAIWLPQRSTGAIEARAHDRGEIRLHVRIDETQCRLPGTGAGGGSSVPVITTSGTAVANHAARGRGGLVQRPAADRSDCRPAGGTAPDGSKPDDRPGSGSSMGSCAGRPMWRRPPVRAARRGTGAAPSPGRVRLPAIRSSADRCTSTSVARTARARRRRDMGRTGRRS